MHARVLYRRDSCTRADVHLTPDRRTNPELLQFPLTFLPRECVFCLREYARKFRKIIETTQNANKTKYNTRAPTKAAPQTPPFSLCHVWQDVVSTPADKYKHYQIIPYSKGQQFLQPGLAAITRHCATPFPCYGPTVHYLNLRPRRVGEVHRAERGVEPSSPAIHN